MDQIFIEDFDSETYDPSSLSIYEYIGHLAAYQQSSFEGSEEPYARSQQGGGYRSPLWEFTRQLKAHWEMAELSSTQALRKLQEWMADSGTSWADFPGVEDGDIEFVKTWDSIRYAPGEGPLTLAAKRAREAPLKVSKEHAVNERFCHFLSIAYWLQIGEGQENILLPCRQIGELLGCSPQTVSNCLQIAEKQGFVVLIERHKFMEKGSPNQAAVYRFAVDRFDPETRAEKASSSNGKEATEQPVKQNQR
jgi:hypothetical protein